MSKRYNNSFRSKLLGALQSITGAVVLRSDLNYLGEPRQISRALKALVQDGDLIKFGYGVYIKAEKTPYSDEPIMTVPLAQGCAEALNRLGIRWELGQAIRNYNEGETQQVPTRFTVRLHDRFRGRLGTKKRQVNFEGRINAR
jgi:hypothetical protein